MQNVFRAITDSVLDKKPVLIAGDTNVSQATPDRFDFLAKSC